MARRTHPATVEALARRVHRAIALDRYGIYARAGILPLPVPDETEVTS